MKRAVLRGYGFLVLALQASLGWSSVDPVEEFRSLADNRVAVRTSLGLRSARPLGPDTVEVVLGLSTTQAAANPQSYRVISRDDASFAYDHFVQPVRASVRREPECDAVAGAPFVRFERSVVTLTLPTGMKEGARYTVVAQGASGQLVTGTHTAGSFIFHAGEVPPAPGNGVDMAVLGLRQLMPEGNGVIKLEFGPDFATEQAAHDSEYTVTINGKPARIVNLGRITRVDSYIPEGWPFLAILQHEVFLQVEPAFKEGDRIAVEVSPKLTTAARSATLVFQGARCFSDALKVNQIGYLTDSPVKIAYLGRWMGSFPEHQQDGGGHVGERAFWAALAPKSTAGGTVPAVGGAPGSGPAVSPPVMGPALAFTEEPAFSIIPAGGGAPVFTGKARLIHLSGKLDEGVYDVDHSGENVYQLNFTEFKQPGQYRITVAGVGCSLPFEIGPEVYRKAFEVQSYGIFAQRCGIALNEPYSSWQRIACHKKGLILTSQGRTEEHDIVKLPGKVIYEKNPEGQDADELALDRDPSLVADYPFNGTLADRSGHQAGLAAVGEAAPFTPVDTTVFRSGQSFGPTLDGAQNGATGQVTVALEQGLTVGFWFKKSERFDFGSTFFSIGGTTGSQLMLEGYTGAPVLRAGPAGGSLADLRMDRPCDNRWHHIAAVLDPAGKTPRCMSLYLDGRVQGRELVGPLDARISGRLQVAGLAGVEAGGACFRDFRIYARTLDSCELSCLAKPQPALRPSTLQAYGGHHDAGDYNPRSHYEVAQRLMDAYEMAPSKFFDGQLNIPERGNGLPDILDEAFWALRLWIDLQDGDGGVRNGTESNGDPIFVETVELDPKGDYAYAKDAEGSYLFAGLMAQASRLWRCNGKAAEADAFLLRARRAYEWAEGHPLPAPDARSFGYHGAPPRAYAAAQLLHTTREARYNQHFVASCVWNCKPEAEVEVYGQYDMQDAAWAYLSCPPDLVDPVVSKSVRSALMRQADDFIRLSSTMAYAFVRHPWAPINWGTGAYETHLRPVVEAYFLTKDRKYLEWMIRTCDNTLGANPLCRSYVVGAGTRTVRAPWHNSRFSESGEVVNGQQVEGPVQSGNVMHYTETAYPPVRENMACLYTFADAQFAMDMDEGGSPNQSFTMATFGLLLPDR